MDKINVIKKNGLPLNEQDKQNFRNRLAIVCFQLGFVIVEDDDKVESLPSITAEDLESLPNRITAEDLQLSKVNPNCEVCDD